MPYMQGEGDKMICIRCGELIKPNTTHWQRLNPYAACHVLCKEIEDSMVWNKIGVEKKKTKWICKNCDPDNPCRLSVPKESTDPYNCPFILHADPTWIRQVKE